MIQLLLNELLISIYGLFFAIYLVLHKIWKLLSALIYLIIPYIWEYGIARLTIWQRVSLISVAIILTQLSKIKSVIYYIYRHLNRIVELLWLYIRSIIPIIAIITSNLYLPPEFLKFGIWYSIIYTFIQCYQLIDYPGLGEFTNNIMVLISGKDTKQHSIQKINSTVGGSNYRNIHQDIVSILELWFIIGNR